MQVSTTPKWKMPSGLKFGLMLMYSPTSVLSQTNKSYDLLVQPCGRLVHNGCIRPKLGGLAECFSIDLKLNPPL